MKKGFMRLITKIYPGEAVRFYSSKAQSKTQKISLKNKSSKQWLQRHITDEYVKRAAVDGWRCRSAYKLLEIHHKHHLFKPGMVVIDCGTAPGSWSQVAAKLVRPDSSLGKGGMVVSLDRDHFEPVDGCFCFPESDFEHATTQDAVKTLLGVHNADLVMSDMAPNASGHKTMDHERIISLVEKVFTFSKDILKPKSGSFLCKIWEGNQTNTFINSLQSQFNNVHRIKPQACRVNSAELFLLASEYKPPIK